MPAGPEAPAAAPRRFTIRHARADDARRLADIHRRSALDAYPWVPAQRWRDADWAARIARGAVRVAEAEGRAAGFAWLCPDEVGALYVDPDAQGLGLGAALLRVAEDALRPARAFLWVIERNAAGRAFYERQGWRHDGTVRDEVWGPVLRYAKPLDAT